MTNRPTRSSPLMGQMMQMPLMISSLLVHAARHAGDIEIVSKRVEGDIHRYTYKDAELRARKLAQAFARLGCEAGDRVATLAWNGYRHFEIYYGSLGLGTGVPHHQSAPVPRADRLDRQRCR
jgi:acyl-CoA synthetase (AMP-forming)/AMP-acid ligase II